MVVTSKYPIGQEPRYFLDDDLLRGIIDLDPRVLEVLAHAAVVNEEVGTQVEEFPPLEIRCRDDEAKGWATTWRTTPELCWAFEVSDILGGRRFHIREAALQFDPIKRRGDRSNEPLKLVIHKATVRDLHMGRRLPPPKGA